MTWILTDKELSSVFGLEASKRYGYLIKKVADQEMLWSLWDKDGWALAAAEDKKSEAIPIWPHKKFAEACATGSWDGYEPKRISLDQWLSKWIPGMEKDRRLVAIFPTPIDKAVLVTPSKVAADLGTELENYG